jgi:acetoin utilization deacetylase AcuC-like enzyme
VPGPAAETPARARAILEAIDARVVDAEPHPDEALLAVHDGELLAYLASAWGEWSAAELPQEQVVPYVFANRELGARREATAVWAKPGWFAYDTMTLVGPGTWEAARAAVDAALTAADLRTGSVHVDPAAGWFPHFLGFADESDESNLNLPLAPGSGDGPRLRAVAELVGRARGAAGLVVALGVDAATGDPESPLQVSVAAFREAGRLLGTLALPTVVVQEGGYDPQRIGGLVRETLVGLEEGRP